MIRSESTVDRDVLMGGGWQGSVSAPPWRRPPYRRPTTSPRRAPRVCRSRPNAPPSATSPRSSHRPATTTSSRSTAFAPPLFTQRILLVAADGRPYAATTGAGIGGVEPHYPATKSTPECPQQAVRQSPIRLDGA
ncbi:hypothetical protein [Alloactinosynnema sp. L-07]|nr:hypothetical protein [Alloactinosynnema sp. L-07]